MTRWESKLRPTVMVIWIYGTLWLSLVPVNGVLNSRYVEFRYNCRTTVRSKGQGKTFMEQPKLKVMKRLRTMMMMLPFAIQVHITQFFSIDRVSNSKFNNTCIVVILQLLQLPAAIATIKMSLLKSLLVAKMAIVLMLLSYIITMKQNEVTLLTQPQHHEHFYQTPSYSHDEDDGGWLGRWLGWMKVNSCDL